MMQAAAPALGIGARPSPSLRIAALGPFFACGAAAVALTVSANLLTTVGVPYVTEGGALPFKLHPASWLAVLACLCSDAARHPVRQAARTPFLALAIAFFGACALYAFLVTGCGNSVVLLDGFLPALALAFALDDAPDATRARLRLLLRLLFAGNALLGIAEQVMHFQLIPLYLNDAPYTPFPQDFRPTALFDHPLTAGAATGMGLFLAPSERLPRYAYVGLLGTALLAFGGRMALGATLLAALGAQAPAVWRNVAARRIAFWRIASCAAVAILAAGTFCALLAAGLGERLAGHFYWDESASTRLLQWRILPMLSVQEVLLGTPRDTFLATLNAFRLSTGVEVIENFWLLFLTTLGIAGFVLFAAGFLCFLRWAWDRSDRLRRAMVAAFVLTTSASNSLGRKSSLLIVFVAVVIAAAAPRRAVS